jgi:hypothetical protein
LEDFSTESLKAGWSWNDAFQSMKKSNFQSTVFSKDLFQIEGEIKTYHDKQNIKEFLTSKPRL